MNYLSFFKVFLPSNSSERLLIPLAFVSRVEGRIPDKASLRNCKGKVWPVKVTKDGIRFHFCDGWPEFIEDNSLEFGEFLVFDYDNTGVFNVRIFEMNGCLKEGVESSNLSVCEGEEKEHEEEEDQEVEEEKDTEVEEEDDDNYEDSAEEEEEDMRNGNKGKAAISDEDVDDVSRPKYPYFVTELQEKRGMSIPTDLIKVLGLELPEKLIVLDEDGRKFSSNVIRWKDGRIWVTKWKSFCNFNDVKQDRLVCEFVPGEGSKGIQLKVCILRKGSSLPKGDKVSADFESEGGEKATSPRVRMPSRGSYEVGRPGKCSKRVKSPRVSSRSGGSGKLREATKSRRGDSEATQRT